MEIEVTREIAAPSERVWRIVTDIEASPQVLSNVEGVERLDDGGEFAVGTRWRETRRMFGKAAIEEMVVTEVESGRRYTVRAESAGTAYTSVVAVEPVGSGSRVTMRFGAEPSGAVAKVLANTLGRLFAGATRKMLQRDLDDIAAWAESGR